MLELALVCTGVVSALMALFCYVRLVVLEDRVEIIEDKLNGSGFPK